MEKDGFGYGVDELERLEKTHGLEAVERHLKEKLYKESVDYKIRDAINISSHSELEKLAQSNISEKDYIHAAIKFERDTIKNTLSNQDSGLWTNLKKDSMKKRYKMNYNELYAIYSKGFKNYQERL